MEPGGEDLEELCERISSNVQRVPPFESTFGLVVAVLALVAQIPTPAPAGEFLQIRVFHRIHEHLSTTCKLGDAPDSLELEARSGSDHYPQLLLAGFGLQEVDCGQR